MGAQAILVQGSKTRTSVMTHQVVNARENKTHRVCVVGAGSFGSVIARVAAQAFVTHPDSFWHEISWWVRRSEVVQEINDMHTNSQYLGDASLPKNLRASTDLRSVAAGSTICIVALPGQFLEEALEVLNEALDPNCIIVSLIKSLKLESGRVVPYSEVLRTALRNRPVAVLMGPNLYKEMARDEFAEATIACTHKDLWQTLQKLFETRLFHVELVPDVIGVEMCGCLKNTVTISTGFAEGLGLGGNVRCAIMRRGLLEIGQFLHEYFGIESDVLLQSSGVGDLVLSCTFGRGRAMAAAFVQSHGSKSWDELEAEMMGGMKLPDLHNIEKMYELLTTWPGAVERYPLLAQTYLIAFKGAEPKSILQPLQTSPSWCPGPTQRGLPKR